MNNLNLEQSLKKAQKESHSGNLEQAKVIYNNILQVYPKNLRARDNLSKIINNSKLSYSNKSKKEIEQKAFKLFNSNLFDELYNFVKEHIINYPNNLVLLNFLGISEAQLGNSYEAQNTFKKIIKIDPKNVDALNSLGLILNEANRYDDAIYYLEKASKIQPNNSSIYNNLGISYGAQDKCELGKSNFLKAIQLNNNFDAKRNLSTLLVSQAVNFENDNKYKKSIILYLEAKALFQDNPDIYAGLGLCFCKNGEISKAENLFEEGFKKDIKTFDFFYSASSFFGFYKRNGLKAVEYAHKALKLSPNNEQVLNNLSIFYSSLLKDDVESINALKEAIKKNPNSSKALGNLANIHQRNGYHEKAIMLYMKSMSIDPKNTLVFSNYLFSISLFPNLSDNDVFKEHLKFGEKFNNPKDIFLNHKVSKISKRKIKLGFVSADFKDHAIKTVLLPSFEKINKQKFEIYAYSNSYYEDDTTLEYIANTDTWIKCAGMSDFQLAEKIWNDEIDILFDMSGHTSGNRLISFSYKPAPIQISWMGYPLTTGLSAMDYTIYDNFFAPKTADEYFVEKILRLPNHFQFSSPKDMEANTPQKERQFSEIIFASFNHSRKLNEEVIDCWCNILKKVQNSKIVIANLEKLSFDWIGNKLIENGIEKSRISLLSPLKIDEYLGLHKKVDILLDTWPYSGGTTTAYALMYGIPVVTLSGNTVAQNQSSGIMRNLGIENSITTSKEHYINKAVELASDINNLYEIKLNNYQKYKNFAEQKQNNTYLNLENLLINLWEEYCKQDN